MKIEKAAAAILLCALAAGAGPTLPARGAEAQNRACDEQPIFSVAAANLAFGPGAITVTAYGMASTMGWKSVALKLMPATGDAGTVTYEFTGCRPAVAAEVMTPVSAAATITANVSAVKRVVIKAATGSQTLEVSDFRKTYHTEGPQD